MHPFSGSHHRWHCFIAKRSRVCRLAHSTFGTPDHRNPNGLRAAWTNAGLRLLFEGAGSILLPVFSRRALLLRIAGRSFAVRGVYLSVPLASRTNHEKKKPATGASPRGLLRAVVRFCRTQINSLVAEMHTVYERRKFAGISKIAQAFLFFDARPQKNQVARLFDRRRK
jgi:hypothetical protein